MRVPFDELPVTTAVTRGVAECKHMPVNEKSKYAIVVVVFNMDVGYLHGAYKLAVSLYGNVNASVWSVTDRYLQLTTMEMVDIDAAEAAGFTHICYSKPILAGWYNRFSIWTMTHYAGVLYLDSDILAVGSVTELLVDGTEQLRKKGRTLMWAKQKTHDYHNSGVLLVRPDVNVYSDLLDVLLQYPHLKIKDQSILNAVFPVNSSKTLEMDYMYNTISYEHYSNTSANLLQHARLLHMIFPKPWHMLECYVWWGRVARPVCDAWHRAPMRIERSENSTDKTQRPTNTTPGAPVVIKIAPSGNLVVNTTAKTPTNTASKTPTNTTSDTTSETPTNTTPKTPTNKTPSVNLVVNTTAKTSSGH